MRTADSRNISRRCFSLFRSSAIKIHRFANEKLRYYRVSRRAGQIIPEQRPENAGRASCRVTAHQRFRRFFAGTHLAAVRQFGSGLVRCGAAGRVRGTRLPAHGIHHEGAGVAESRGEEENSCRRDAEAACFGEGKARAARPNTPTSMSSTSYVLHLSVVKPWAIVRLSRLRREKIVTAYFSAAR
jgi:hypothetical protein